MAEIVVSPSGPGAMEAGLMVDDSGTRFVVLTFKEPDADPVLVTFTLPVFAGFAGLIGKVALVADDEANWQAG